MILPQMQQCANLLIPYISFSITGWELKLGADSFAPLLESILKNGKMLLPLTAPGAVLTLVIHENIKGLGANSVKLDHGIQIRCMYLVER
jgi:hypothetical protein